jgi:AGZA family xanthine/uracil permease-like MFS transporter
MLPVRSDALGQGMSADEASQLAWQAGLVACFGSGLIELGGAFIADKLRELTPRAALLSTLAGIALTFISLGFFLRTYAHPLVAIVPLGVILLTYFGGVKFLIPFTSLEIPGGLLAVILGTILAWLTGLNQWDNNQLTTVLEPIGFNFPQLSLGGLWQARDILIGYFSIILPMGLFNLVGSLQNLESAEAAGDKYPSAPCLAVNGVGSIIAAIFGSCFPTTIYIGHPGWKAMGARIGYSWLNGLVMGLLCLSGTVGLLAFLVPIDSGMAIVLWIGIVIVVQSFESTPMRHAPAVVMGMLPGIAGWGALIAKTALRAAGLGNPERPFSPQDLIPAFEANDLYITGAFALEQGLIFSSMILSAMTVHIIEKQFGKAGFWALTAAFLSWLGFLHSFKWTLGDTVLNLGWGKGSTYALSYIFLALLLFYAQWNKKDKLN